MSASTELTATAKSSKIKFKNFKFTYYIGNTIRWFLGIFVMICAIFPVWWMISIVFSPAGATLSVNPSLYPASLSAGIENLKTILFEATFLKAYWNSLVYTTLVIAGSLFLCSLAAFEFALFEFRGKKLLFFLILIALMIPFPVTLIPTYLLVNRLGWINTVQGLVVPGIASAFCLYMLTQFFRDIPLEYLDAALIDGATHFGTFWHIALPLSKNALITMAILIYLSTWGNFIWPLVVATNADTFTVSQMISRFNNPMSWYTVNQIMTANLLAAIPPLVFYIIFQSKIIKGFTMSGIKG